MKEILQTIIENLVDDKQSVLINEINNEKGIVYEVKVSESDMGKVIGKQGKIATSIRNIIKALATKEHKRVSVEFIS